MKLIRRSIMKFKGGLLLYFLLCSFCHLQLSAAQEVCQSSTCHQLADDLLNHSMNSSASPCEDFYEYICGNYNYLQLLNDSAISIEELLDDNATSSSASNQPANIVISGTMYTRQELLNEELQAAFKTAGNSSRIASKAIRVVSELYRECTDTAGRERLGTGPLVDYIERLVGGWPMLRRNSSSSSSSSSITNWQDIFVNVYSKAGLNYIFDIRNDLTSVKIRAGWTLMDKLVSPKTKQRYDTYDVAFHRQLKKFIFELSQQVSPNAEVDLKLLQDIEALAHFEFKLVHAYQNSSTDILSQLFEASLSDGTLRQEWISMLNRMQDNFFPADSAAPPSRFRWNTRILSLPKAAYLEKAVAVLEATPLEVVQNFFATAVALEFAALTTSKLRTTVNDFTSRKKIFNSLSSEECIAALGQWSAAVDRIYVERHFSVAEKAAATIMVEEMRAAFRENLKKNSWLDASTRRNAIKKLDSISPVVGYEEWILDDGQLDEFYSEKLEGIEEDLLLRGGSIFNGEYFKLCAHYMILKVKLENTNLVVLLLELKNKSKRKKRTYDISSATVNAYYNKLENTIIIPAGFLKPPFFDQRAPTALNYGSIATIIGHELTHCIDSMGQESSSSSSSSRRLSVSSTPEEDDNENWWTEDSAGRFHQKAQCMVEQYDEVVDEAIGLHLDGKRTLMENLSDNAGLKMAFAAFQGHQRQSGRSRVLPGLNFTSEQLFFVSHAKTWCEATSKQVSLLSWIIDNHSPNKYRVNVALGNFEQFAKAFQCPVGSPMNPLDKCSVW